MSAACFDWLLIVAPLAAIFDWLATVLAHAFAFLAAAVSHDSSLVRLAAGMVRAKERTHTEPPSPIRNV